MSLNKSEKHWKALGELEYRFQTYGGEVDSFDSRPPSVIEVNIIVFREAVFKNDFVLIIAM